MAILKRTLIIGSGGYIGSRLMKEMKATGVDINWFKKGKKYVDFKDLTRDYYSEFDNIILLAGHSSVKMSEGGLNSCFNNNVRNFIDLLEKLDLQQGCYSLMNPDPNGLKYKGPVPSNSFDKHGNDSAELNFHELTPWNTSFLHIVNETIWQEKR